METLKGWPARSPDLSPIENMWSIVQSRVDRLAPSGREELWVSVKKAWDDVPIEQVNNLVGSFPTRLRKVVSVKGRTICTETKAIERK